MVLPESGVWIPGSVPHSNKASPDAQIIFLFVDPQALALPSHSCILSISPLVREMVVKHRIQSGHLREGVCRLRAGTQQGLEFGVFGRREGAVEVPLGQFADAGD